MRILFYNWVDYLDAEKRGGGVTVYQRNVIQALAGQALVGEADVETVFLSSGISYDLVPAAPRWEKVRHGPAESRPRRFEIVNSGVLSPSHHSFGNPAQVDHPQTRATFFDFLDRNGPFDVVHFNNLEGLPATVLQLKERFPDTRVILSLHNYYPLCPQVNLWFKERENCRDFAGGRKCETCLPGHHDERMVRLANAVAFNLKKLNISPGTRLFDRAFMPSMRIARRAASVWGRLRRRKLAMRAIAPQVQPSAGQALTDGIAPASSPLLTVLRKPPAALSSPFQDRRTQFVDLVNQNCDLVLGVSDRVCDVAAHFGIAPRLLRTSYIGTAQAPKWAETAPSPRMLAEDGTLSLAYLGYMRRDKGFFFLLDALEALPDAMAARIRLIVCARRGDHETMTRLADLSERFLAVEYADGYSHDQLDTLLQGANVGVVPVMWEDNLPQVAIEMHARHIPLLTADLGGAQELSRCPQMIFEAGNIAAFHERLAQLLAGEVDSAAYWAQAQTPVPMAQHLAQLLAIFRNDPDGMPAPHIPRPILSPPRDEADAVVDQHGVILVPGQSTQGLSAVAV